MSSVETEIKIVDLSYALPGLQVVQSFPATLVETSKAVAMTRSAKPASFSETMQIREPVLFCAKENVVEGFHTLCFVFSRDQVQRAIYYRREKESPVYGYIFDKSVDTLYRICDSKLIDVMVSPTTEQKQEINDFMELMHKASEENSRNFYFISDERFFKDNGVSAVALNPNKS